MVTETQAVCPQGKEPQISVANEIHEQEPNAQQLKRRCPRDRVSLASSSNPCPVLLFDIANLRRSILWLLVRWPALA